MKKKILSLLMAMAAVFGALPLRAAEPLEVAITSPRDRAALPWRPCVSGSVSDRAAEVWLIISDKSGNFFVQPGPLSVKPNKTWSGRPYIAEKNPALFEGLNLEMRAVANPAVSLAEGMVLARWPSAQASSAVIDVVYQDDASDGCLTSTSSASTAGRRPYQELAGAARGPSQTLAARPGATPAFGEYSFLQPALQGLGIALALLFLALIAMPHLAAAAIRHLTDWLIAFVKWLVNIALVFKDSIVRLCRGLFPVGKTQSRRMWDAGGFTLDFRLFSFELLAIVPLYLSMVVAFYSESATICRSLNELFGIESTAADTQPGLAASLMDPSTERSAVAEPQTATTAAMQNRFVRIAARWLARFNDAFDRLWESEPLGFLAMALAALQASFSIVLLWGMGFTRPLNLRLGTLLRDRPLVTEVFLGLTLALTALAAFRGAKVTVGSSWVLSMCVSAALSLVLPAILGLTAHYAWEATADCLGLANVSIVIALFNVGLGAVVALWTLALLLVLAAVGLALAGFSMLFVLVALYMLFAEVMGNFLKELRGIRLPQMESANASRLVTLVSVATVAGIVLAAYFVIRG